MVIARKKVEILFCPASPPLTHLREASHSVVANTELTPFLVVADGKRPKSV